MSIFKFMVDNQYFINSNEELENYTLIKGKVIKPDFSFSNDSQISNGIVNENQKKNLEINTKCINNIDKKENINLETNRNIINNLKTNNNENKDDIENNDISFANEINLNIKNKEEIKMKNNEIFINKNISKNNTAANLYEEIDINNKHELDNKKFKELILNLGSNNKFLEIKNKNSVNKGCKKNNFKNINDEIIKGTEKNDNYNYKNINSSKSLNLTETRKIQRAKINLPTKASTFLEYFGECLEKAKEAFNIEQKAFTLFKIPYLYNVPNDNMLDYINEDNSKLSKKLKVKNYLLNTKIKYSLIIQGESINLCTSEGEAGDLFWFLIQHSRSIICCRCSPIQKSKIVKFVKKNTKDLTLAIGDGENDVNMIKTAHIGIGLYGKEGANAAFNSDYAFYEFKYLKRLLFANGRFILLKNSYLYK